MKQIGENWDKIHRLSKIIVKKDYEYIGLGGKSTLKVGTYFITGFWADAVGLSDTLNGAREINNKCILPSKALMRFYK